MNKWILTSAFCKARMLEECLENLYYPNSRSALPVKQSFKHIVIDNHYPVDKANNRIQIQEIALDHGCIYVDSGKDMGLHEGLNNAIKKLQIGSDSNDLVITLDPDDRPQPGSMQALADVMLADPTLAVLGLNFSVIKQRIKEGILFREEIVSGHTVLVHPSVEMWNVASYSMPLLESIGGFKQTYAYYGGIESALYEGWKKKKMFLGYLKDFTSEFVPVDRNRIELYDKSYGEWKLDHVGGYTGSFEEWLKK